MFYLYGKRRTGHAPFCVGAACVDFPFHIHPPGTGPCFYEWQFPDHGRHIKFGSGRCSGHAFLFTHGCNSFRRRQAVFCSGFHPSDGRHDGHCDHICNNRLPGSDHEPEQGLLFYETCRFAGLTCPRGILP